MTPKKLSLTLLPILLMTFACSPGAGAPKVTVEEFASGSLLQRLEISRLDDGPSVAPGATTAPRVSVTLKVEKARLFGREFLYGADLQYSSYFDADGELYNQSLAIGHIPAVFRIAGDELQLVADNRRLYPSEVNHPERVLSRFKIVAEEEASLTISGARSDTLLAEIFKGTHTDTQGAWTNPTAQPPRDHWIRSLQFVAQGDYLLQETSVVLADGSIAEFMESVFPRETLKPGEQFEAIRMEYDHPTGGDEGILARYRLLKGEKIYDGEDAIAFAQHYDISGGATIDWYVTRNIPDEMLEPVRQGVEGWNRYFRSFKGIEREVVRFLGRLPEDVKLGDPRYNVINWDNRLVAGAAYESQANDPHTGKQSHSLVYLPAAWIQIGQDYWTDGQFADLIDRVAPELGRRLREGRDGARAIVPRIACARDLREATALLASGLVGASEVEKFGVELLRGTLFHEIGHALGLAHNFRGSLVYEPGQAGSLFSSSIMDYNNFEVERAAFNGPDTAEGPQLEYDRQALSAIYNRQADVRETDAEVPVCNDDEADNEEGWVDPLCVRYDVEKDPTRSIDRAFARVNAEKLEGDATLAQALRQVPEVVAPPAAVAEAKDAAAFKALAGKLAGGVTSSLRYFYITGRSGVSRTVRTNLKSLLVFGDGVLPEGYSERELRERAFAGVTQAIALRELSEAGKAGVADARQAALAKLEATPHAQGLSAEARAGALEAAGKAIDAAVEGFRTKPTGLPRVRAAVFASLSRHAKVPYFLGKLGEAQVDYETAIIGTLADAVVDGDARIALERTSAASSLVTFKGRLGADAAVERAVAKVTAEREGAVTNAARELADGLLKILKSTPAEEE